MRIKVAAEVGCDPRSVERVEQGETLRAPAVEEKIVRVAKRLLKERVKPEGETVADAEPADEPKGAA